MTSANILAVALFTFSASAFAQDTLSHGGPEPQPRQLQESAVSEPHQHRYVYIGRDRIKTHLDRPADSSGSPDLQPQDQASPAESKEYEYVTIGRDRTRVRVPRRAERSGRNAEAMGISGETPAPAAPLTRDEDLKGGPN